MLRSAIVVVCMLCLVSCTSNYTIHAPYNKVNNPTSFTFEYPVSELIAKLEGIFSVQNQAAQKIPLSAAYHSGIYHGEISQLDNLTYKVEFNNLNRNFWPSDVYEVNGESAKTTGAFVLLLTQTGEGHTKVTAQANRLQVINGVECCGPHGRYSRYTDVASTTIEEYAFLLFIGHQLGLEMSPIKRPGVIE